MRLWLRILLTTVALAPGTASAQTFYVANLSGAEEVPANASGATGFGRVMLNDAESQITVSVYYSGLGSNAIGGHIHGPAAPGVNTGIAFNLGALTAATGGSVQAAVFAVTPTQVANLKAGLFYMNIHSANFTNGEIRGQLRPDPYLAATLTGVQEVPGGSGALSTGRGYISVNAAGDQALVTLLWLNLTSNATSAHMHEGRPGAEGTLMCDLLPPEVMNGGVFDVLCPLTPVQASELKSGGMYVNIHTTSSFSGEIRGQIKRSFNPCDFDGDGKSDYVITRDTGSAIDWWIAHSGGGMQRFSWGVPTDHATDRMLCPDIDGDGKADATIWREASGTFWTRLSSGGIRSQVWGTNGDDPRMVGDYDGDGRDDYTIWRASTGTYWIMQSTTGTARAESWGTSGDFPQSVPDYDGDGRADFGIQRGPTTGSFFRKLSWTNTIDVVSWGNASDFSQSADFDGDGKTDIAISRVNGNFRQWWVRGSLTGQAFAPYGAGYHWGSTLAPSSLRTSADFDGDRRADVAVWKAETGGIGVWWIQSVSSGTTHFVWGVAGDLPVHTGYWK